MNGEKLFKLTANDEHSRKRYNRVKIILYDGLMSFRHWLKNPAKILPNKVQKFTPCREREVKNSP